MSNLRQRANVVIALFVTTCTLQIALAADMGLLTPETVTPLAGIAVFELAIIAVLWNLRSLIPLVEKAMSTRMVEHAIAYRRDDVTGVLNRSAFMETSGDALRGAPSGLGFLIHFDLDHLKTINDTQGHAAGDHALRRLAEAARIADPEAIVGRLGGDEFAMLSVHRPASEAKWVADAIQKTLSYPARFNGQTMPLSASMGIAFVTKGGSVDELLQQADLALYVSKRRGRSRATAFDPDMLAEKRQTRLLERELRAAILLQEFELDYQPVYNADGVMTGCEALLRWRHSVRGRVMPSEFIPVAENAKLIGKIGEWVLKKACSDFAAFADLKVGVNISPAQLRQDGLVETVGNTLKETGLPPQRLVLEITETINLDTISGARTSIERLRGLGVHVSIDDFGAGQCGFSYLQSYTVDSIKIDRSFIANLGTSQSSTVLVGAIVSVAHACGTAVLAEGIETAEQLKLARAAGANLFQGYFLSRPVSLSQIKRMVANRDKAIQAPDNPFRLADAA